MANIRRRNNMQLVSTEVQVETFVQRATFKIFRKTSDGLVSVSFGASSVLWNKPTPMGATILDLSKPFLYRFRYEKMLPRYGSDRLRVVHKDTVPLLYRI